MAALQNIDKISFCVDTLIVKNGRKLRAIRPDEDGYYTMPLAVLGTVTQNNTYYEVEDFVEQLTSPQSVFCKCLTAGSAEGEYGHPKIALLPENLQLTRLSYVDEQSVSHHIRKVWAGEKLESGGRIIYGKIKPKGPYGSSLKESLDDPCQNTSFSLRSIAASRHENGIIRRRIKHLVTFDYVTAGGYAEASKRYAPSTESFDIPITTRQVASTISAMEQFTNTELNEIFGAKVVMIGNTSTTLIDKESVLLDKDGKKRSIYTTLLSSYK